MTVETAQILCTVLWQNGVDAPYRPTHVKHPVVRQASADAHYLSWICEHGVALSEEYTRRYGKIHKSGLVIDAAIKLHGKLSWPSHENAPMCMPAELASGDVVTAYRNYLKSKYSNWGSKARWTNAEMPAWLR
jgi:hypothetical protein